ncbi:protein-methionine sulfoxide oxidase mical3b isoform X3 [Trichomycterus rosablanca]|uniref:protein-methionine sulfoxide oxidase mical3b isoform X3 n=1 Tax=Trichomycterus rosablanca TaxID=2290929 RepID=UPI002F355822
MGDGQVVVEGCHPYALFDSFVQASTCRETLRAFQELCTELNLQPGGKLQFYRTLRSKLNYWRAKALWAKLDKRAGQKVYQRGLACANTTCLIIGAGPCGLRTAIELSFLGARVVLVEKRDAFSRNNVLHLWPSTIQDLRGLGAKKFYGKFCAGSIDHISIRQLQLILLKVALLLGVEVHVNVEFKSMREPVKEQEKQSIGWRAEVHPTSHPVSELEFDVVVGADGRRNTLPGFRRKEFRGKLAIAITANFINRNTTAEAKVEEISGVAFIFNQRFFQELRSDTGIDLENIVYYKDDTHYFVMTAKKQSLLKKGVILRDYADTELLLSRSNVDQNALLLYAREAADFSTNHQLPTLDFAMNHYGQPDVAMFDFTCMYASENAALVRQRRGHGLLVALVGDSLLEPFWPMGTGIARGFLAAMDTAWMVRSWGLGTAPLEVLAERESVYRLLPQTTPENVSKNYSQYSLDPATRYPNLSTQIINAAQVWHLIDTDEGPVLGMVTGLSPASKLPHKDSTTRSSKLLGWCQEQTKDYRGVCVTDLTMSWRSGLALCALIHRYRPDLIDFDSLDETEAELNNQLALDIAEQELGISPIMTGQEMSELEESDSLCMVMYLSQLHDLFKDTVPPSESLSPEERAALVASTKSPMSLLNRLGQNMSRKRNTKEKKEKDDDGVGKRRRTSQSGQPEEEDVSPDQQEQQTPPLSPESDTSTASLFGSSQSRVKSMASQLQAKFEENAPSTSAAAVRRQKYIKMYTGGVSSLAEQIASQLQSQHAHSKPLLDRKELGSQRKEFPVSVGGSDICHFCTRRVYIMERLSAEGKFFHRSCFQCGHCSSTLHLSNYAYDEQQGKFYCKQHYSYRLAVMTQRKTPAPITASHPSQQASPDPSSAHLSISSTITVEVVPPPGDQSPSTPPDVPYGLAKQLGGTPERIALENYKPCLQELGSPLLEVPEETLAQHNLSQSLQEKGAEEQSSSESELEEDEEEPQAEISGVSELNCREDLNEKEEEEEKQDVTRVEEDDEKKQGIEEEKKDVTKVEEDDEKKQGIEEEKKDVTKVEEDDEKKQGIEEEKQDVSGDEEEELESSDEGEYSPWDKELLLGVWIHEEEAGGIKESFVEHSDDPELKHLLESSCGLEDKKVSIPIEAQPSFRDCSLSLESTHTPQKDSIPIYTLTSNLPVTPVDPSAKRTEVIGEFWLKSAEIRKSLGLASVPLVDEQKKMDSTSIQSSCTADTFYVSATHTPSVYTSASDSPSHTPHKSDLSSQTSGTPTQSICTRSTEMSSQPDIESATTHVLGGTPYSSSSETPEVHRPDNTMKSHVIEENSAMAPKSFSTETPHRVSGLLTPPFTPPVARQDMNSSNAFQEREVLISSGSCAVLLKRDLQKSGLNRAQSLPTDEVEVLYDGLSDNADKEHPCPATSSQLPFSPSVMKHSTSSFLSKASTPPPHYAKKDRSELEGRRTLSEAPMQVARTEARQWKSEIEPLAEERKTKHSSLFSPQKSKKSLGVDGERQQESTRHKSLWKSVFSGHKKDKKKREMESVSTTLPNSENLENRKRTSCLSRTDLSSMKTLSFSEDRDLQCCGAMLERSPLRSQKSGAEEDLDAKLTRRVQRAARRQAKQEELKRLHRAQIIQRQLEQVEVKQKQLEEKGIAVEKALRGEADYWEDSSTSDLVDIHLGVEPFLGSPSRRPVSLCPCCSAEARAEGTEHDHSVYVCTVFFLYLLHEPPLHQLRMGKKDDPSLMQQWFKLVQEKNALVRYESELMIFARELELEDRQSQLQQELRERMAVDDHLKDEEELAEERRILEEMLDVVEQRDALVALLEEQRLREREEDSDLEAAMLSKGFNLHWV